MGRKNPQSAPNYQGAAQQQGQQQRLGQDKKQRPPQGGGGQFDPWQASRQGGQQQKNTQSPQYGGAQMQDMRITGGQQQPDFMGMAQRSQSHGPMNPHIRQGQQVGNAPQGYQPQNYQAPRGQNGYFGPMQQYGMGSANAPQAPRSPVQAPQSYEDRFKQNAEEKYGAPAPQQATQTAQPTQPQNGYGGGYNYGMNNRHMR